MSDLVEFLRTRLAHEEEVAKRADTAAVDMDEPLSVIEGDEFTFLAINPTKALADIEAKRQLIAEYEAACRELKRWGNGDGRPTARQHRAEATGRRNAMTSMLQRLPDPPSPRGRLRRP